ncbi:MAG: hypothetical protein KBT03_13625 [Bacteroidales bacterium]|nr:hypothetical protein [Candidatus Scybalousia scybalohippi]
MSKEKFEIGDIWENDYFATIITKVWGDYNNLAYGVRLNKKNGQISSTECICLVDTKKYDNYKGKSKYPVNSWFEVQDD